MRNFSDLTEREVLALAISNEEEDGRIYADYAESLREDYPASARIFSDMSAEENEHRRTLIDLYVRKFGDHIPLVRRQDVRGFTPRKPVWQLRPRGIDALRRAAREMEEETSRFYRLAASRTTDASVRKLLGDLAEAEMAHTHSAEAAEEMHVPEATRARENDTARRRFILQVVQPGLVGLMDGSVSTLAPVFAAAIATHDNWNAFLVGMAASLGAGISMGFAEALADDGRISGRGLPLLRGLICGLMTFAGGIGHTLPFLIHGFRTAVAVAAGVVVLELLAIAWIRWRTMDTNPVAATVQVLVGGGLVFATGVLIGSGG
jgi:erythrin-vacuolar iron transport family protein